MIEREGCSRELGEALRVQARQMFHWWHRVCDGRLAPANFAHYMRPIRREVERWLEAGQICEVPKTEGTCREMLKLRQALWTFVRHPEVEPTNNASERAIRPGVLCRKSSFGTQRTPLCGKHDDRRGNAQATTPSRPRLSYGRVRGSPAQRPCTFLAPNSHRDRTTDAARSIARSYR